MSQLWTSNLLFAAADRFWRNVAAGEHDELDLSSASLSDELDVDIKALLPILIRHE